MTKKKETSPWDTDVDSIVDSSLDDATSPVVPEVKDTTKPRKETKKPIVEDAGFDMEGLMTDFPTAPELERFVYDQTGIVLNLKGRSNKLKYQVALDCLNGIEVDPQFTGHENPYVNKAELVPVDNMKQIPDRDASILSAGPEVNVFDTNLFPHPDPELKAQGQNCQVRFAKYASGMITYEILGPITKRAVGERINKYGQTVPEKYTWVDPRTGEQVIVRGDGSLTPLGSKIRAFMRRQRMNKSNMWDVWVDRDFVVRDEFVTDNPWSV